MTQGSERAAWLAALVAVFLRAFYVARWRVLRALSSGLLGDRAILWAMAAGELAVEPFDPARLGPNSLDVTLSEHLAVFDLADGEELDVRRPTPVRRLVIPPEGFRLVPGVLYLGSIRERVRTRTLVPDVDGKSSIGRLGMSVHATAGRGDAGFRGYFTLEITVKHPLRVFAGMPVGQVYLSTVMGGVRVPYGERRSSKYSDQGPRPVPSAMYLNFPQEGADVGP
jgi:dCTP deaminase